LLKPFGNNNFLNPGTIEVVWEDHLPNKNGTKRVLGTFKINIFRISVKAYSAFSSSISNMMIEPLFPQILLTMFSKVSLFPFNLNSLLAKNN